ncbi:hypothetical protein [Flavobacterium sp.]|uniref:hypothetical protein n=1 Tax=Flavobacterium sp. TaxID=239 RepID=UPI0025BA149E|nr:hypothetical protein [Flavobacterium sp.]|tara:strand:- start:43 stop:900 length:858 start_codon:yes stop_codon:yes gene_type:complete
MKKYIVILLFLVFNLSYSQNDGCWFSSLLKDFDKNSTEFKTFFNTNPEAMYAYEQLYKAGKSGLKQNTDALNAYIIAKDNVKLKQLGFTDELLAKLEGAANLSYADVLLNLNRFGNTLASNNITLVDFNKIFDELYESSAKRDGANWVIKYVGGHANEFTDRTIKFEYFISNELGGRFIDLTDITYSNVKIFYEFKSVSNVPPGHFKEQFMKDLTNANSLDQVKWIFNGAKNPPDFRTNMINAIDNLPITDALARKLIPNNPIANANDLKDLLETDFDKIFKLVN